LEDPLESGATVFDDLLADALDGLNGLDWVPRRRIGQRHSRTW
jgi:hypothetical protein